MQLGSGYSEWLDGKILVIPGFQPIQQLAPLGGQCPRWIDHDDRFDSGSQPFGEGRKNPVETLRRSEPKGVLVARRFLNRIESSEAGRF